MRRVTRSTSQGSAIPMAAVLVRRLSAKDDEALHGHGELSSPGYKGKACERFHAKGRMLPDGLVYLDSWLGKDGDRCFQLIKTNDPSLFVVWQEKWNDLVSFEVVELGEKSRKSGTT